MNTIQLKTPEELYKIAPDLATIAERLENSVKNTATENAKLQKNKRDNKDVPGYASKNFKTRYPEHFRITEIIKQGGSWEKIPTELKSGREQFEREITTIATTRNPQAMKIAIFSGKATRNTSPPEAYIIYLTESAKTEINQTSVLGNEQESKKIKELESKFLEIHKADGNGDSVALLKADFAMQLKIFKHESEMTELKRSHERTLEKKQDEINDLEDEIEELEEQLADSDGKLSGAAELINAKQKPPAMQEVAIGILSGLAKKLAVENPQYLSAVTHKTPEEVKQMLLEDEKAFASPETKVIENTGASFSEAPINEYEGRSSECTQRLKNLHLFAKSLSPEDLLTFNNICAFCCLPDGNINKANADLLSELIQPKK